jgi:hypothetical protein
VTASTTWWSIPRFRPCRPKRDPTTGELLFRAGNIANHFYTTAFLRGVAAYEEDLAFHIARNAGSGSGSGSDVEVEMPGISEIFTQKEAGSSVCCRVSIIVVYSEISLIYWKLSEVIAKSYNNLSLNYQKLLEVIANITNNLCLN